MPRGLLLSVVVVLAFVVPVVVTMDRGAREPAETERSRSAGPAAARPAQKARPAASAALDDHQIAAGSVLTVVLRTTVGSATSAVGDQVDAELAEPIVRDGLELLPAGSTMRGSVVDALPAARKALRGRIAVAFFVVEHPRTGSRAAIQTRSVTVDASAPADKEPMDVMLAAGHRMNVVLAQPLLIRIPK